jgi:hypothetical protein
MNKNCSKTSQIFHLLFCTYIHNSELKDARDNTILTADSEAINPAINDDDEAV